MSNLKQFTGKCSKCSKELKATTWGGKQMFFCADDNCPAFRNPVGLQKYEYAPKTDEITIGGKDFDIDNRLF